MKRAESHSLPISGSRRVRCRRSSSLLATEVAPVTLILAARIALHDPLALKEWADSIRVTVARQLPGGLWDLAPLWMYPDNPVIAQTAQWLADRSGFPLSPAIKLAGTDAALLAVPAIRRVALKKLADSTVIGRVTRDAAGALGYRYAYHGVTDEDKLDREEDAGRLARGRSQKLRMKDLLAWELTGVQGAPKFMLGWPASERNAAIQAIAKYIETNAHRFRAKPARLEDVACSLPAVYLAPELRRLYGCFARTNEGARRAGLCASTNRRISARAASTSTLSCRAGDAAVSNARSAASRSSCSPR